VLLKTKTDLSRKQHKLLLEREKDDIMRIIFFTSMSEGKRCPHEKGKKAEGFWGTFPGGMEKMVPLLAANLNGFPNLLLLAAGTIFGMETDNPTSQQVSHCPGAFFLFHAPPTAV